MARILVVDDEVDVANLVRTTLEAENHSVDVATSGREALERMLSDPPDLLVLDLMMPEIDGMELLRLIRMEGRTSSTPVLILSARTETRDQIGGLQLDADAYVCKPFSPKELLAEVRDLLRGATA